MKLYRTKIPVIAHEVIGALVDANDIEVSDRAEAEADLVAIMEEYQRRDNDLRVRIKDQMAQFNMPYGDYGKVRKRMSDEMDHPVGDDVERFLARQFVENMLISRFIEEVWSDDAIMYRKIMDVLREHDVDERAIREEAATKVKNVREGTVEYEIAIRDAVRDIKKRKGLIGGER